MIEPTKRSVHRAILALGRALLADLAPADAHALAGPTTLGLNFGFGRRPNSWYRSGALDEHPAQNLLAGVEELATPSRSTWSSRRTEETKHGGRDEALKFLARTDVQPERPLRPCGLAESTLAERGTGRSGQNVAADAT